MALFSSRTGGITSPFASSSIPHRSNRWGMILPLAVMLMLVLLVGVVSFNLTRTWDVASSHVTQGLSRFVILNHVYWELKEAAWERKTSPVRAQQHWVLAKQQLRYLSQAQGWERIPPDLKLFLADDRNLAHISSFLKETTFFSPRFEDIQRNLSSIQEYVQRVTLYTTISLVGLGLVLMAVIAWDFWRSVQALERSRDLGQLIQEEERRRIAQDLHDGVIQELVDLKRTYEPEKVDRLVHQIRRVCNNLKPQILEDIGLCGALEFLAEDLREEGQRRVKLSMDPNELSHLPAVYELPLFRMVQELFNNIKRHSHATEATLNLVYVPDESKVLRLYIQDNGCGMSPNQNPQIPSSECSPHSSSLQVSQNFSGHGLGLTGVRERLKALGGKLVIKPRQQGTGTLFQIIIPIHATHYSE